MRERVAFFYLPIYIRIVKIIDRKYRVNSAIPICHIGYSDLKQAWTMDTRQLYTFRMVASLGSFHEAADALDYAQSTVSDQIRTLEQDLGVKLFKREGRHITLTKPGELFLEYTRKMINIEE